MHYAEEQEANVNIFFLGFLLLLGLSLSLNHMVTHRWHCTYLPEAGATMLVGMLAGLMVNDTNVVNDKVSVLMGFSPSVFFVAMLPPIIFNSGYDMKRSYFFANIYAILAFAIIGTFLSTMIIGTFLYFITILGMGFGASFAECESSAHDSH